MLVKNLEEEFSQLIAYWSPQIIESFNGQFFKIAKLKGEFLWHNHAEEDELFWVYKGELRIKYKDTEVHLRAGDLHTVPRGTEHLPVADDECWVVLIEPHSTQHTGAVVSSRTRSVEEQSCHLKFHA